MYSVCAAYARAHNEWRNDFLPQRIVHSPAKRSHSSFPLFQMQVFVTQCDDWLSDSSMYWWGNWFEDWLTARQKRTEMRRVSGCGIALQWHKKREPSTAQRAKWTGLSGAHRSEVIHTRNECILCMRVLLVRVIYVYISIYWFLFFLQIVRFLVAIWLRKKSFLAKHNKDVDFNKQKNRFNESVSDRHKTIRFLENNS